MHHNNKENDPNVSEESCADKNDKKGRKRNDLKIAKCVSCCAVVLASAALISSITAYGSSNPDTVAASSGDDGNQIEIQLDEELYNSLCSLSTNKSDDSNSKFFTEDGNLYVLIDGTKYRVVDSDDGLKLYDDEDETLEDFSDVTETNPNVYTDENGVKYYHIVWGDTLCSISSDLHYSVDELADYNHIRNVHLIYAESDLRIPDDSNSSTSSDTTE